MADEADLAAEQAEREMALFQLQRAGARTEAPDEDDAGNRYCLDCGEIIPPERVAVVQAVRCVYCEEIREHKSRFHGTRGGIMRYLERGREKE
jgi:DnaK suppressor protein